MSIGKLHFRSIDDDNGFSEEVMPLHVVGGIGDPTGWLREPLVERRAALRLARDAGRGDSDYQGYDGRITDAAVGWLRRRSTSRNVKPWVLFVSLVCPHFPLIARPEWYGLYPEDKVPAPAAADPLEIRDLAKETGYAGLVADCHQELRAVVDPDAVDALAKADQRARIAAYGGHEKILELGSFGHSGAGCQAGV